MAASAERISIISTRFDVNASVVRLFSRYRMPPNRP
jgi:hypothetical protein